MMKEFALVIILFYSMINAHRLYKSIKIENKAEIITYMITLSCGIAALVICTIDIAKEKLGL